MEQGWIWLREIKDTCEGLEDYFASETDGEATPIRIPLLSVDFGTMKYTLAEKEVGDLELLYELKRRQVVIIVKSSAPLGSQLPSGTLHLSNIQAADLSIHNETPGSAKGIVAQLVVETSSGVEFKRTPQISDDDTKKNNNNNNNNYIRCCRITLTASIHECGHLRDMLWFLQSGGTLVQQNIMDDSARDCDQYDKTTEENKVDLTFGLPHWILYFPWWLYSRRLRKIIQICLLLYTIFSIAWATWQLYRHSSSIQVALQPIVDTLKLYFSSVMELVDIALHTLTDLWMTLISPLNILGGIALTPLINALTSFANATIWLFSSIFWWCDKFTGAVHHSLVNVWSALGRIPVVNLVGPFFTSENSPFIKICLLMRSGLEKFTNLAKPFASCLSKITRIDSTNIDSIRQKMGINVLKNKVQKIATSLLDLKSYQAQVGSPRTSSSSASTGSSPRTCFCPSPGIRRWSIPVLYRSPRK